MASSTAPPSYSEDVEMQPVLHIEGGRGINIAPRKYEPETSLCEKIGFGIMLTITFLPPGNFAFVLSLWLAGIGWKATSECIQYAFNGEPRPRTDSAYSVLGGIFKGTLTLFASGALLLMVGALLGAVGTGVYFGGRWIYNAIRARMESRRRTIVQEEDVEAGGQAS